MGKIFLFGSTKLNVLPQGMEVHLQRLLNEGHEFIVGDKKGIDTTFHSVLSRIGAHDKTTVVCMDGTNNNKYKFKTKVLNTQFFEESKIGRIVDLEEDKILLEINDVEDVESLLSDRQYFEFKDKYMISECDIAICIWSGDTKTDKREFHCIQLMGMHNKNCFAYTT